MMGSANVLTGSNPHGCGCTHAWAYTHTPLSPPFYFPLSLSLSVTGMTIVPSVHHIINMSPTVLILLDI